MKPKAIQNFVFFASYPSQESKPRGILKLDGEKDVCEWEEKGGGGRIHERCNIIIKGGIS